MCRWPDAWCTHTHTWLSNIIEIRTRPANTHNEKRTITLRTGRNTMAVIEGSPPHKVIDVAAAENDRLQLLCLRFVFKIKTLLPTHTHTVTYMFTSRFDLFAAQTQPPPTQQTHPNTQLGQTHLDPLLHKPHAHTPTTFCTCRCTPALLKCKQLHRQTFPTQSKWIVLTLTEWWTQLNRRLHPLIRMADGWDAQFALQTRRRQLCVSIYMPNDKRCVYKVSPLPPMPSDVCSLELLAMQLQSQ